MLNGVGSGLIYRRTRRASGHYTQYGTSRPNGHHRRINPPQSVPPVSFCGVHFCRNVHVCQIHANGNRAYCSILLAYIWPESGSLAGPRAPGTAPAGQIAQGGDREHDRLGAGHLFTCHRGTRPGVLGGDPGDQLTGPGHDQVPGSAKPTSSGTETAPMAATSARLGGSIPPLITSRLATCGPANPDQRFRLPGRHGPPCWGKDQGIWGMALFLKQHHHGLGGIRQALPVTHGWRLASAYCPAVYS